VFSVGNSLVGDTRIVTCETEIEANEVATVTCTAAGTWSLSGDWADLEAECAVAAEDTSTNAATGSESVQGTVFFESAASTPFILFLSSFATLFLA
jgi:hypothetical protein